MRKSKIVRLGDREITVKELTVAQVRSIISELESNYELAILDLMFTDVPSLALQMSTGLSDSELDDYSPSELTPLIEAFREANPFFVQMMNRLSALGEVALQSSSAGQSAG